MSRDKTNDELLAHKTQALQTLSNYLDTLISSASIKEKGKADKLCYWLEDWTRFIDFEKEFSPMSLRRYERGEIIKVHLGFNVGSEEGGLHYAVVLDKNNPKSSPVVTIAPLTSVKPKTDVTKLKKGALFLGNEIFTSLNAKMSALQKKNIAQINYLHQFVNTPDDSIANDQMQDAFKRLAELEKEFDLFKRIKREIQNMRVGSIALVNQITTISKIRIYDPKTDHDILSGVKLSNEKLDLIDNELKLLFTKGK